MTWAIDIGNTQTVVGLWDGTEWKAMWRLDTDRHRTEDELAVHLEALCRMDGFPFTAQAAIGASVVPQATESVTRMFADRFGVITPWLVNGTQVGLPVTYDPPHAVGADRLANALGALALYHAPVVVVDFGTATTFDVVDASGAYAGGAILPGVVVSMEALASRAAKLPQIALREPSRAIGRNVVESLEAGVLFGAAGAIEELAHRISEELGTPPTFLATGGLGEVFVRLCPSIHRYCPTLTLDGLIIALDRMRGEAA
jgi:type III pantothenate kinase